ATCRGNPPCDEGDLALLQDVFQQMSGPLRRTPAHLTPAVSGGRADRAGAVRPRGARSGACQVRPRAGIR
ncbi:hypothetical protein ABZ203_29765, partial [Streptomyces albidoflavus]|uniref:hypothetical protein n=1 Tax=Streptomyces albidoflavus TaxID=1886 RepID=UPI0033A02FD6